MSLQHTIITRLSDNLVLCETETQLSQEKRIQVNQLLQRVTNSSLNELIVESNDCYFAISTKNGVCYLVVCDKAFSKRLAFAFLSEIQKEFETVHGNEVRKIRKPYACMVFGDFIHKTEHVFCSSGAQSSIEKVQEDLKDVQKIMTQNVQDILERGVKLSHNTSNEHIFGATTAAAHQSASNTNCVITVVSERSDELLHASARYHRGASDFSRYMALQRVLPALVVALLVLIALVLKFFVF